MNTDPTTRKRMSTIFNEWAQRYAADPDSFGTVLSSDGTPIQDYGEQCTAFFELIANELDAAGKLPIPN